MKTKNIKKYLSKRSIKAKAGATLVELVAVVCILAIASSTCIGGMFAMADVAKRGQDLSYCERTSDMISRQLSVYGNSGSDVQGYVSMPTASAYKEKSNPDGSMDVENPGGFMDVENPSGGHGNKNDYFLYADPNVEYRLILARFDTTTSPQFKTVTTIDNVKSITFNVKKLHMSASAGDKYILQYTVTTVGTNIWDQATDKRVEYTMSSGVVLNNTNKSTSITELTPGTNDTITMKSPSDPASNTWIRIRTSSRSKVDIS